MAVRDRLYRTYWAMERKVVPGLTNSQSAYEEALTRVTEPGVGSWLDLGCGHRLLPDWRYEQELTLLARAGHVVGLDLDLPSLRMHRTIHQLVHGDIGGLPFADGAFDLVTCNMVFEHLDAPEVQLAEIERVLKPGGRLVFHTPNATGYAVLVARFLPDFIKGGLIRILEGRPDHDVFKTYYRCNTPKQIEGLSDDVGFEVESIELVSSNAHFAVVPPLALLELLLIRLTQGDRLAWLRSNLIVTLRRPHGPKSAD